MALVSAGHLIYRFVLGKVYSVVVTKRDYRLVDSHEQSGIADITAFIDMGDKLQKCLENPDYGIGPTSRRNVDYIPLGDVSSFIGSRRILQ